MTLILANIARVTRTFAMAIWVGGLIFFVVVAAVVAKVRLVVVEAVVAKVRCGARRGRSPRPRRVGHGWHGTCL